ncbi:flap endonuclease GEN-like 2 isoform X2 [Selaginella moellendorffii]|uniref:flap endonuclease GEN-like 2 isoform X2 n=1 Tax=Selaginella moellendorffii TaxID=88036 RepID=UPI000D1CCAD1|nr:flap endonuclease GEN-like 2 isoform X2 [Selaginella moellendorffii]|eukprot:XP_024516420.1 flap endonuclease GEN-like 2 isoform X2 [Selaginella moellendorffii]
MGVHKLWEILEPAKERVPLDLLVGQGVCIDLSYWIIQLNKVNGGAVKDKPHLRGLFHRIRALLALNCHLIFVTDGAVPAAKAGTYVQRLARARQPLRPQRQVCASLHLLLSYVTQMPNQVAGLPLKRNKGSEFGRMVEDATALATAFGIPCLVSLEEAEAQCAALNAMGFADACFTADSDALLFGAKVVYKDISLKPGESHVVAYDMTKIRNAFGYGRNSLIALGILLGCDYFPGVHGLGPEKAQQIVKKFGEDKILEEMLRQGPVTLAKRTLKCKDKANSTVASDGKTHGFSEDDNMACKAIFAYTHPKCHAQTSEAVHSVLLGGRLQMDTIRRICMQEFDWSFEKTDDYILPKLAERDVHRMASMQAASSGVNLAGLQFKISEIVKKRQLRGVDHYEVKWVGNPDIPSSAVRAELVQRYCHRFVCSSESNTALHPRAYPSKVAEFMAKLALKGGKSTRRPNDLVTSDLCGRLNKMTVEDGKTSMNKMAVKDDWKTMVEVKDDGETPSIIDAFHHIKQNDASRLEVIDLTSPVGKGIHLVEASDNDDDDDLKHQARVRQLKSFIASIK